MIVGKRESPYLVTQNKIHSTLLKIFDISLEISIGNNKYIIDGALYKRNHRLFDLFLVRIATDSEGLKSDTEPTVDFFLPILYTRPWI